MFHLYLAVVDHIVGHMEIHIQVRYSDPLDALLFSNVETVDFRRRFILVYV